MALPLFVPSEASWASPATPASRVKEQRAGPQTHPMTDCLRQVGGAASDERVRLPAVGGLTHELHVRLWPKHEP
jgi:hypothetical protein